LEDQSPWVDFPEGTNFRSILNFTLEVSTSKVQNSLGVLDTPFECVRGGGVDFGNLMVLFPVLLHHRVRNSLRFVEKTSIWKSPKWDEFRLGILEILKWGIKVVGTNFGRVK